MLRVLYEIAKAATRAVDDPDIADATTDQLRQLFKADSAVLWLWDEGNSKLIRFLTSTREGKRWSRRRLDAGEGTPGQAFMSGQPVVVEDYASYPHALPDVVDTGMSSAIAVPLLIDGRAIGAVALGSLRPRRFRSEESQALVLFAEQLAPVARGLQLRTQLLRRRAEAEALADLARQGVLERDLSKLLSLLAEHTARLLGASYSVVVAVDARNKIAVRGTFGVLSPKWRTSRAPRRGGSTQAALAAGKTLVFEREMAVSSPRHAAEGALVALVTPLPTREGLSGVLHAGWREPFQPGPEDLRLLETLAAFGAGMIDNAQSHHKAEQFGTWLHAIIDHLPHGVAVADAKSTLVLLNQSGRRILGGDKTPWLSAGLPLKSPKMQRLMRKGGLMFENTAFSRALEGEAVRDHEYLLPRNDGQQIWIRASASPVFDSSGKFEGAVAVFYDQTEAKETAALKQRETDRQLAVAAISEALSGASRDVPALLEIIARTLAAALDATCTIRLLADGRLSLVHGAVGENSPSVDRALRRILKDPSIASGQGSNWPVITSGTAARWFDATGFGHRGRTPANIVNAMKQLPLYASLIVPLRAHGTILGTIGAYRHCAVQPFSEEDERFVNDIGERAGLVLENARLFEQLGSSRTRLEELSHRLVRLQERERRTMALELHDEVGQGLTAARLLLQAARRLPGRLRDERLDEACQVLDEAVAQVRGLSLDLRPPMLDGFGLAPALEALFERFVRRTQIDVRFRCEKLSRRAPSEVEMAAYRIVQEGLTNVARHAGVTHLDVDVGTDKRHLWLRLADEGVGFDTALLGREPSTGLTGMQERAELLGGELTVESAPGAGTRLQARLPLSTRGASSGRRGTSAARR